MEVITPGRLPQEKNYRGTCGNCGQVYNAMKGELIGTLTGNNEYELGTKCTLPGCGERVYFKPWDKQEITKAFYEK